MQIAERVTVTSVTSLPFREGCFVFATAEYANGGSRPISCVVAKGLKAAAATLVGLSIEKKEMQAWAKSNGGRFHFQKFLRHKLGKIA